MYEVTTYDFSKKDFKNWKIKNKYHAVYILENGESAYIGETTNVIKRAKKHNRSLMNRKYKFKNMHVITSELAEATPAHHYEKLLIQLMKIDNKFNILNETNGYNYVEYKRKYKFELYFDKLWSLLEKNKLVSTKNFKDFLNSETYKYSPFTILNKEQKHALTSIINALNFENVSPNENYESRPIVINGDPGTGKTLVAISLFYYLRNNELYKDKSIAIVVSNSTLREEIKYVFTKNDGLYVKDIISPTELTRKFYDILIVDEAHKLRRGKNLYRYAKCFKEGNERLKLDQTNDELDWVLKQSKFQIMFYDKKQIVSPTEIPYEEFEMRVNGEFRNKRPIKLKKQMRIQAGSTYVKYIYKILNNKTLNKKNIKNYELKLVSSYKELEHIINTKNEQFGLSRISSGYGFKFKNDGTNGSHDIFIDNVLTKWNTRTKGWIRKQDSISEVGSIYTLTGIDLNYAGVVIGPEVYYDKNTKEIKINKDMFFDRSVKNNTNYENLKEYILNTYLVLLTRGIKGTYIYVCDKDLREYFLNYIDLI